MASGLLSTTASSARPRLVAVGSLFQSVRSTTTLSLVFSTRKQESHWPRKEALGVESERFYLESFMIPRAKNRVWESCVAVS